MQAGVDIDAKGVITRAADGMPVVQPGFVVTLTVVDYHARGIISSSITTIR